MSEAFLQLKYCDTRFSVRGDSAEDLQWLIEFLWPAFQIVEGDSVDYAIEVLISPDRHRRLRERLSKESRLADCFTLDGSFQQLPVRHVDAAALRSNGQEGAAGGSDGVPSNGSASALLVYDTRSDSFFVVHQGGAFVQVVAECASDRVRLATMRVIRELATTARLRSPSLALHAAALCVAGRAVLVAGAKRSGKTSVLLAALQSGCGFLGNDRAYVDTGEAVPVVRGMPTIIKIRLDTLGLFPDLPRRMSRTSMHRGITVAEAARLHSPASMTFGPEEGPSLNATQLCRLLDTSGHGAAALGAILFPTVCPDSSGSRWERLSETAGAEMFPRVALRAATPQRVSEVFFGTSRDRVVSSEQELQMWRSLVARVPCWRCTLGNGAFASTKDWARRLAQLLSP